MSRCEPPISNPSVRKGRMLSQKVQDPGKLLIVDDDNEQGQDVLLAAREVGFGNIYQAKGLQDAYRLIESEDFPVAVIDIMLSKPETKKEGLHVIKRLHELQPQCLIIALTTRDQTGQVGVEALEAGAHDFIDGCWKYINWKALLEQRLILWRGLIAKGNWSNRRSVLSHSY
jgi:DNA-binding NtrC family response regulator